MAHTAVHSGLGAGPHRRRRYRAAAGPFDPADHTVAEVEEYLTAADPDEFRRIYDAEAAGKERKGILALTAPQQTDETDETDETGAADTGGEETDDEAPEGAEDTAAG